MMIPRIPPITKLMERTNHPNQLDVYELKKRENRISVRIRVIPTVTPTQRTGLKNGFPNTPITKPITIRNAPK